jgi:hypothetical protein
MQVGANRVIAKFGEPSGDLLRGPIEPRQVMDDDDAAPIVAGVGAGQVGLDLVAIVAAHADETGCQRIAHTSIES